MDGVKLREGVESVVVAGKMLGYEAILFGNWFYIADDKVTYIIWYQSLEEKFILEICSNKGIESNNYSTIEELEKKLLELL